VQQPPTIAPAPAPAVEARRGLFPRGLTQPAGGFRFGADTLLLSAFAARSLPPAGARGRKALTGLDLGTGCGAASLGLLLLRPDLDLGLTGIDSGPEMVQAAAENAGALGLDGRFRAELADVRDFRRPGSGPGFDLALANPPFRTCGTGRTCADEARNRARFEGPGGLAAFAACAARCLRPRGRLFLVHLAERLPELLRVLADAGLEPRRALPVPGRARQAPRLVLLDCLRGGRRSGGAGFALLAPLVLYALDGSLTPEAAGFCPPLTTNPRRAGA
jgi:tRNA1Val (adenine37-N6)-methyltransferase